MMLFDAAAARLGVRESRARNAAGDRPGCHRSLSCAAPVAATNCSGRKPDCLSAGHRSPKPKTLSAARIVRYLLRDARHRSHTCKTRFLPAETVILTRRQSSTTAKTITEACTTSPQRSYKKRTSNALAARRSRGNGGVPAAASATHAKAAARHLGRRRRRMALRGALRLRAAVGKSAGRSARRVHSERLRLDARGCCCAPIRLVARRPVPRIRGDGRFGCEERCHWAVGFAFISFKRGSERGVRGRVARSRRDARARLCGRGRHVGRRRR